MNTNFATEPPPPSPDAGVTSVQPLAPAHRLDDGVLLATLADDGAADAQSHLSAIAARLPEAKAVVFDLRRAAPAGDSDWLAWHFDEVMAAWLCSEAVAAPGERTRLHLGHPAQDIGSTGYCSAFTVRDARRFAPSASARKLPVVFLVNACSALPSLALALQDAGLAAIDVTPAPNGAFSGGVRQSSAVASPRPAAPTPSARSRNSSRPTNESPGPACRA